MRALTSAIRWKSRGCECVNTQLAAGRPLMAGLVAPWRTRPPPRSRASPRRSNARHSASTLVCHCRTALVRRNTNPLTSTSTSPARAPSRSVMLSVSSGSGIFARTGLVTVRTSARTGKPKAVNSSPTLAITTFMLRSHGTSSLSRTRDLHCPGVFQWRLSAKLSLGPGANLGALERPHRRAGGDDFFQPCPYALAKRADKDAYHAREHDLSYT